MENDKFPKRKQIRLKEYNYSANGAYFVTVCTKDKKHLFWEKNETNVGANCVRPYEYQLSHTGCIVDKEIKGIDNIYGDIVKIDKYVIIII